jgi:hypothetical protein
VFESLTEAQWVGFSFGMALIGGMLTWGVVRNRRP